GRLGAATAGLVPQRLGSLGAELSIFEEVVALLPAVHGTRRHTPGHPIGCGAELTLERAPQRLGVAAALVVAHCGAQPRPFARDGAVVPTAGVAAIVLVVVLLAAPTRLPSALDLELLTRADEVGVGDVVGSREGLVAAGVL